jgi:hypothetical protein
VTVQFTQDDCDALAPCFVNHPCALSHRLVPDVPIELSPREAREALTTLAMVGARPAGSPRPNYYDRLTKVSVDGGVRSFTAVHDMLRTLVDLGGEWLSEDVPGRALGFSRRDGHDHHTVGLVYVKEAWGRTRAEPDREWGRDTPLRELIRTPAGRVRIARMLTTGDHRLEFLDWPPRSGTS